MHILAIIDSNPNVGLGHLKRCTNFLSSLRFKGRRSLTYLLENCCQVDCSKQANQVFKVDFCNENQVLNRVDQINRGQKIDLVVIDSYHLLEQTIHRLTDQFSNSVILMMDDFNRLKNYRGDFLLNYNPLASKFSYKTAKGTQKFLGLSYFPFSQALRASKERIKKNHKNIRHVLVTMGGSDPDNFTKTICQALSVGFENYIFHVVIGPMFKAGQDIAEQYKLKNFRFYFNQSDLTQLMSKVDAAITSAGMTSYELCFLNKPVVIVAISKDQIFNARFFKLNMKLNCLDNYLFNKKKGFVGQLTASLRQLVQKPKLVKNFVSGDVWPEVSNAILNRLMSKR